MFSLKVVSLTHFFRYCRVPCNNDDLDQDALRLYQFFAILFPFVQPPTLISVSVCIVYRHRKSGTSQPVCQRPDVPHSNIYRPNRLVPSIEQHRHHPHNTCSLLRCKCKLSKSTFSHHTFNDQCSQVHSVQGIYISTIRRACALSIVNCHHRTLALDPPFNSSTNRSSILFSPLSLFPLFNPFPLPYHRRILHDLRIVSFRRKFANHLSFDFISTNSPAPLSMPIHQTAHSQISISLPPNTLTQLLQLLSIHLSRDRLLPPKICHFPPTSIRTTIPFSHRHNLSNHPQCSG